MQRVRLLVLAVCLYIVSVSFWGCGNAKNDLEAPETQEAVKEEEKETYEIALVSDLGTINDHSFNQASWEGIIKYATEYKISYKNYEPMEGTLDAYLENIELAIANGAKLVICPGYNFETPVYIAQDKYPDVMFILIDGEPHNIAYSESRMEDNVLALLFKEEQAGFLAGYAAVKDGYTKLGFVGGMAVPSVIRYGYGFVQGCDYAANEMGIDTEIAYTYAGTFSESEDAKNMAASWYQSGTQVIFACGGAIGDSIIAAAEQENARVIGVDADQSIESETVITSAMKMITSAIYHGIEEYYSGNFPGGSIQRFSVENDGVGLPLDTSKFTVFSKADYDQIYTKLVSGNIEINNQVENATTADLTLYATTINFLH